MKPNHILLFLLLLLLASCTRKTPLEYALQSAGDNRTELEYVLKYYANDPEKLAAAQFLIENMPAHYSYNGDKILEYYKIAEKVLKSNLAPSQQRDSLLHVRQKLLPGLERNVISDIKIINANFLIYSIDNAFQHWKNDPWAQHINFDEFCEYLLPYKSVELQELDYWRDTLSQYFGDNIANQIPDDEEYNTAWHVADITRHSMLDKVKPYGVFKEAGYPMLSATTMKNITYGRCIDYVTLGVNVYRSLGIPSLIDYTPFWGRYRAGHSWDVLISNRGEYLPSEWDISTPHSGSFFQFQTMPKVFRHTYSINRERVKYKNLSKLKYPFALCEKDVTETYSRTSQIIIQIPDSVKLAEDYAYISIFNGHNVEWSIVDYGEVKSGKACFSKIGRNILYIAQGFDGKELVPISLPFILHPNGEVEFINFDNKQTRKLDIRRKYYQSRNVAEMRQRLLGGKIQAANRPDFSDSITIYSISDVYVPDLIVVNPQKTYKYYRYLSANGTYGSIAELKFFYQDSSEVADCKYICTPSAQENILKVYDGDYLTNFESPDPDGIWAGISLPKPEKLGFVRIVPRSDDNDIHIGDTYELLYYNNAKWVSLGKQTVATNVLTYNNVPTHALYWVRNHTRGWDERPFLIRDNGKVEWR